MKLVHKLKQYEKQLVFLRWDEEGEYGKINYVGNDFIEFIVLDIDTLEYSETMLINPNLIMEVILKSPDINRVIFELSCNLPTKEES